MYSIFEVEGDLFRVINDKNLFQFLLLYNVIFPPPFIDFFEKDQIFIILEFEFGGADLENSNGKVSNCSCASVILVLQTYSLLTSKITCFAYIHVTTPALLHYICTVAIRSTCPQTLMKRALTLKHSLQVNDKRRLEKQLSIQF